MNPILEHLPRVDLSGTSHRGIAFAALYYEQEHPVCEQVANSFESLLARTTPPLSGILQFGAVTEGTWSETLSETVKNDRKVEQWRQLEQAGLAPFNPADREGKAAPQCVIVAGARHLLDQETRERFRDELAKAAAQYSQFLIIFVADIGEIPFDMDENAFRVWIRDFARLIPKPVALHLVSTEFDDGQPIALEDLADGVAVALLADIGIAGRVAVRILSDIDESASVALHAVGVKGLLYDAESAADAFKASVTAELAQRTLSSSLESVDAELKRLISPREMFASLILGEEGVAVRVFQGNTPTSSPLLRGRNYAIGFDFDGADPGSILKGNCPDSWSEAFRTRREFLLQATVPASGLRIAGALAELRGSQVQDLVNQIADAFVRAGVVRAQSLCDEFGNRISDIYWTTETPGTSDPGEMVERVLSELNRAVERIPSVSQLVPKGIIRLLPAAGLAWLAWRLPLPFQFLWFWICGIGACACVGHLGWRYWRAVWAARTVAGRAAEQIHREMRTRLVALAREHVVREGRAGQEQIAAIKECISKIIESLTALGLERASLPRPSQTGTIKRTPWRYDQVKVLDTLLHAPESLGRLYSEVMRFVSDAAPGILDGVAPPNVVAAGLQRLSGEYCRERFSRLCLADLLQKEGAKHALARGLPSFEEESRHFHEGPAVFLQNVVLKDCRSQSHRIRRTILIPEGMEEQSTNEATMISLLAENIAASIVRVELARLSDLCDAAGSLSQSNEFELTSGRSLSPL